MILDTSTLLAVLAVQAVVSALLLDHLGRRMPSDVRGVRVCALGVGVLALAYCVAAVALSRGDLPRALEVPAKLLPWAGLALFGAGLLDLAAARDRRSIYWTGVALGGGLLLGLALADSAEYARIAVTSGLVAALGLYTAGVLFLARPEQTGARLAAVLLASTSVGAGARCLLAVTQRISLASATSGNTVTLLVFLALQVALVLAILLLIGERLLARAQTSEREAGLRAEALSRIAAELGDARAAAELANRRKTSFLTQMSHEIRTPLHSVLGLADLLAGTRLDPVQGDYVRRMTVAGRHLLSLVSNVLDLAKIEAGRMDVTPVPFDLRAMVEETLETFRGVASDKGLSCESRVARDVPLWVFGDVVKLRQVLHNLLGNAIKFTDSGSVEVRVERSPRGEDRCRIRVLDTGPGFSREAERRLFESFSSLEDTRAGTRPPGTGLGLAISRKLLDLLGGTIEVQARPGGGTCVELELYLPPAAAVERPTDGAPGQAATGGVLRRALIVEDDELAAFVLRHLLEAQSIECEVVGDGTPAIERLVGGTRFDLVFVDRQLPTLDGIAVIRRLRELEREGSVPRTFLVVITADAFRDTAEAAAAAGCDAFLTKPVDRGVLAEVLQRAAEIERVDHVV